MRTLKKLIITSRIEGQGWTNDLPSFLLAYHSTLHGSTNTPLHKLVFGRAIQQSSVTGTVRKPTSKQNEMMELGKHTRRMLICTSAVALVLAGSFLVNSYSANGSTTTIHPLLWPKAYSLVTVHGSRIIASRNGKSITQNASFFKDASQVSVMPGREEPNDEDPVPPSPDIGYHSPLLDYRTSPAPAVVPTTQPDTAGNHYPARVHRAPRSLSDFVV